MGQASPRYQPDVTRPDYTYVEFFQGSPKYERCAYCRYISIVQDDIALWKDSPHLQKVASVRFLG
jgi:hypothetical protein